MTSRSWYLDYSRPHAVCEFSLDASMLLLLVPFLVVILLWETADWFSVAVFQVFSIRTILSLTSLNIFSTWSFTFRKNLSSGLLCSSPLEEKIVLGKRQKNLKYIFFIYNYKEGPYQDARNVGGSWQESYIPVWRIAFLLKNKNQLVGSSGQ